MKKFNWKEISNFIFYLCFAIFTLFGFYSMVLLAVYLHEHSELVKAFVIMGFGLTILGFVVMSIIVIIDFACKHKKRKNQKQKQKQKYTQSNVIIREDIVV